MGSVNSTVGTARSCYIEAIQKAKEGKSEGVNLLLLHAEDQLMSAEGFKTVALEMIDVYKRLEKLENK